SRSVAIKRGRGNHDGIHAADQRRRNLRVRKHGRTDGQSWRIRNPRRSVAMDLAHRRLLLQCSGIAGAAGLSHAPLACAGSAKKLTESHSEKGGKLFLLFCRSAVLAFFYRALEILDAFAET